MSDYRENADSPILIAEKGVKIWNGGRLGRILCIGVVGLEVSAHKLI